MDDENIPIKDDIMFFLYEVMFPCVNAWDGDVFMWDYCENIWEHITLGHVNMMPHMSNGAMSPMPHHYPSTSKSHMHDVVHHKGH
jgi:hypothetical protein